MTKEERQEYNKKYYQKNKEQIKKYKKEYRNKHAKEIHEYEKEYRKTHKEDCKRRQQKYYEKHKEKNRETERIRVRKYYANNKNKVIERRHKVNENGIPYYAEKNLKYAKYKGMLGVVDYNSGNKRNMGQMLSANPSSLSTNKYSKRKGVSKNSRGQWEARLTKNGITYRKKFKTYEEAVVYREYLEDTYFDETQKQIKEYFEINKSI